MSYYPNTTLEWVGTAPTIFEYSFTIELETIVIDYGFIIESSSGGGGGGTEEDGREKSIYLETNIGAIRLTYNSMARRRIEDLAIAKAKSTGYAKQFELIANHLETFGVDRDAAKLKLFKPRK